MEVTLVHSHNYIAQATGKLVHAYKVVCLPEEKAVWKEKQGHYYRENANGIPMYYTLQDLGKETRIKVKGT